MSFTQMEVLRAVERGNKTAVSVSIAVNGRVVNAQRTLDRLYVKGWVLFSTETGNYYISERGKRKLGVKK
jgi:predicted transcriptional regulator